jgi:hypothetical protein
MACGRVLLAQKRTSTSCAPRSIVSRDYAPTSDAVMIYLAQRFPDPANVFPVPRKVSLLVCLGNCARSHCSAAVSSHKIGSGSLKIAKFPVKFPVSREFAWRQVRSALRRQPGSRALRQIPKRRESGPEIRAFRVSKTLIQAAVDVKAGSKLA